MRPTSSIPNIASTHPIPILPIGSPSEALAKEGALAKPWAVLFGASAIAGAATIAAVCFAFGTGLLAFAQYHPQPPAAAQNGAPTTSHAAGTFDGKLVPQGPEDKTEGSTTAHLPIDEQYHGDFEATRKGEMLNATPPSLGIWIALICLRYRCVSPAS